MVFPMIVNVWDSNFTQNTYSVLGKKPQYIDYVQRNTAFDGITLFTDEWINNPIVDGVRTAYKIGWLREPQCLHPETYARALENLDKFDFILTYYQPFLDHSDKFRFCPYGGVWIERKDWGLREKTKNVSMLYGDKMSTEGHRIRHEIADVIRGRYDVDFYGYEGTPVGYGADTKLRVLGDYRYTIVTETCSESNLFTEILLDCFAVGTVPIFWGCPNVRKYFDSSGLLHFDEAADVEYWLMIADKWQYMEMMDSIRRNYTAVRQYEITEDWIYENVLREIE